MFIFSSSYKFKGGDIIMKIKLSTLLLALVYLANIQQVDAGSNSYDPSRVCSLGMKIGLVMGASGFAHIIYSSHSVKINMNQEKAKCHKNNKK